MKKVIQLAVLSTTFISQAFAGPLVVYGEDNRHEVYEATAANQVLAKSTASMISSNELRMDMLRPGVVQLNQSTLSDWLSGPSKNKSMSLEKAAAAGISFCEGTRFADQPNPSICSGFLIAPDLIVTAGHCAEVENMCDEYRWVFDFEVNKETKLAGVDVKEENIYKCKKVVSNALINELGLDYAVVQLDRPVTDREPLVINNSSVIADHQSILVIGNPSGLPKKVADGANVRANLHPNFFSSNLDTFSGNSGSAVFNADTGAVEGILVRGEEDYVANYSKMCVEVNMCASDECRGEDVSRMTSIPEVAVQNMLEAASVSGDLEKLSRILSLNTWVDFHTKDGKSALLKASGAAQNGSIKALLSKGADVNLIDAKGNSALHELSKVLNQTNADALITLVEAGAKMEAKNASGETALLVAGKSLNLEAVKLLIKAGADKNALDNNGDSVLVAFAQSGNEKAVQELADMGVATPVVTKVAQNP